MLFGASGDFSHGGWLEDTLELSLQGILEECGRLGGRWRLELTICCCCGDTDRKGTGRSLLSLSVPVSHTSLL